MLFEEFQSELDRRSFDGADRAALQAELMVEQRQNFLGGRVVSAMTSSAPMSAEMKAFVESYLDLHLAEEYGATEAGVVFVDGQVRRPPVIDYKLADVPDLGYFHTDQPHPRGELLVKTDNLFPGYFKRPEVTAELFDPDGYYRTGDILAEVDPDQLVYLDRRSASRPPCGPCQNSSASIRYCRCCTPTSDPKSRPAGPSGQPTVSVPQCRKRKSARTKTSRTSRRRSSSNTSPTCKCSDCYERERRCLTSAIR